MSPYWRGVAVAWVLLAIGAAVDSLPATAILTVIAIVIGLGSAILGTLHARGTKGDGND